ncbi:MAG: four helix bundle protein [Candidatus Moraniibacteriota bacterium]
MEKDVLKERMDELAKGTYEVTKKFPKDEIFGITSQLRRAALSVILNYIEGFARTGNKELKNFLQISYGSLKETKYLLFFCTREKYMTNTDYEKLMQLSEEIGAMLWKRIQKIKEKIENQATANK